MTMSVMASAKSRDVQVIPIGAGTLALRSRSWNRLRFEIEYALERGTTANTFLIQDEKTALIDPPGGTFAQIFLEELQRRMPLSQIDYLILSHVNPNRVDTLKAILTLDDRLTVICTNPAAIALQKMQESDPALTLPKIEIVRGEEALTLGPDRALQFISTSTPRYPDGLCTYDTKTQILYTDKLFGAHICGDQVFDEGWRSLYEDRRYYFDCLMANQTRQVEAALDKIADLPVAFYAPGHGPLVRYGMHELNNQYRLWCDAQRRQNISVALLYASAYGNTTIMANAIALGITKSGVTVESLNCETTDPDEIRLALEKCSGFIIGSPTLAGHLPTQVQTALGLVLTTAPKGCPAGVFGSFGWSGEAVEIIANKLQDAGFTLAFEPIRIKFTPTDTNLQLCEETGVDFGQTIKEAKRVRARIGAVSSVEQAMGRVVGSLSVVTVQKGDVRTAMLASWISQASFLPPGLTVAVAKERAIESYMHEGDGFVVNILEQGKQLQKYFLKKFAPGEDRFLDVATETAGNGSPFLKESLAYLECRVTQRMEAGDHWIVYATIENGKVLQPNGLTAVHHRKSGSYY